MYDLLDDAAARDAALAGAGDAGGARWVRLLAPLVPHSIRDFLTFEEHVEGMVMSGDPSAKPAPEWYEAPTFYFTNVAAVTGPYDDVAIAPGSQVQDFELEVGAVIGREGANLSPAAARDHIAGYVVFNDWSARDLQFREMNVRLGPAKGKDSANTLGPWLVTADELEPYRRDDRLHLEMTVSLNGEPFGADTLANMAWSFEEMAAYASRGTRVMPGDVLGSGTCGSGCLGGDLGTDRGARAAAAGAGRRRRDDRRSDRDAAQSRRRIRLTSWRCPRPARRPTGARGHTEIAFAASMTPARVLRKALDVTPSVAQALRCLGEDERPFALVGAWCGGGAVLGSSPVVVAADADDPFALLDRVPEVVGSSPAGFVGGGWVGYLGYELRRRVDSSVVAPPAPPRPVALPDAALAYYDHVLRLRRRRALVVRGAGGGGPRAGAGAAA